ncbi:30S ribosomal protein S27ae [sediment metagenome]|uniref:30S ribosomal protein S27ae n=1 Tax=sediment metagenome TaxID=749907 RepID=D9PM36_9ZZZZ
MADKKPASKGAKKGAWNRYEIKGDKVERKNKSCPKCGQGFLLANHKNRKTCGGCGYTEFSKQ